MKLRMKASVQYRLELPEDVQAVLKEHEEAGTTSSKEYNDAFDVFAQRHMCKLSPLPAELIRSRQESSRSHGGVDDGWVTEI